MKRLQNRIAEGGMTLPVAALLGLVAWLAAGLISQGMWPQLACHVATVYLLIELSNQNALLRVRSRMVSSTFILLSCTAPMLFPQFSGAVVQLCFVAALLLLFHTYQNSQTMGLTYYAFLALGLSSLVWVHVLWYVPVVWLLMATQLQSLSGRTWMASLLGLVTPYWFASLWLIFNQDFSPIVDHFTELASLQFVVPKLELGRLLVLLLTLALTVVGAVHFWNYAFEDKIRVRQLYGLFSVLTAVTVLFLLLQPQHGDVLLRLLFVFVSPLIAHVMTFTSSKASEVFFFSSLALVLALTAYNVAAL